MLFLRSRTLVLLLVLTVLHQPVSALASGQENEGERRENKWRQNAERIERELGTRDLTDLYRRATQSRSREITRERQGAKNRNLNADGDIQWKNLGPTFNPTYTFPINTAKPEAHDTGLITAIAPHPSDSKILVVGAAGGGLWRSTDTGQTWTGVGGELPAGALQIGAVAFAADGNRVYAGTGCGDSSTTKIGRSDYAVRSSIGALRSNDGGVTWGATKTSPPSEFYWALSVNPTNPDDALAGTNRGIYRTTDGGDTWTSVLNKSLADITDLHVTALSRTGEGGNTIYAGLYKPGELPGLVYRSSDGGATWEIKSAGLPGNIETRGRAQLAASPTNSGRVYVLISGLDEKQVDMARSDDGGDTWTALNIDKTKVNILATQGNFANVVAVDPKNPDVVYAGGLDLWRSRDAGATWTQLSDWSPPQEAVKLPYAHADQHAIVFGPDGTVYIGNDGGIYRMTQDPVNFIGLNKGILAWLVDGICASADGSILLNGAQDNGTSLKVNETEWRQIGGGDGYACLVNPANPQIFTISTQNQGIQHSANGGQTFDDAAGLTESKNNRLFNTILRQHPENAGRIFTATKRKIWQSNDNGANWFEASKDMPIIETIADFSISSADGQRMLLVDKKGQVVESNDGGTSWARIGEYPLGGSAEAIRGERGTPDVIYVASKILTAGKERLWRSTDRGKTWQPVSKTGQDKGLPDLPIFSFEIDPKSKDILWAGTFIGLYRSADGGQTWARHGTGLPSVPVTDIILPGDQSKVVIGTSGRGLWEASAGTRPTAAPASAAQPGLRSLAAKFSFSPANPRPGRNIQFVDESAGATSWTWTFGTHGSSHEVNPAHIFAEPGTYDVTLTVSDGTNSASTTQKVTVAYPDTGTGDALTYLMPVLVRIGATYDTELTLTNRSGKPVELTLTFKGGSSAPYTGFEGSATYSLPAGQKVFKQAFEFLKANGMTGLPEGTLLGSLRIAVRGANNISEFSALSRVTTPPSAELRALGVIGRFGLAYTATPLTASANKEAYLYGLQQTSNPGSPGARSNVACVHAGGSATPGPITLEISYRNGETGLTHDSKDTMTLQPFEWFQIGAPPLRDRGIKQGWAQIKRTSGSDQFLCYATVVDNVNGDAAYVPMSVADTKLKANEAMVPVVMELPGSSLYSELTIANRTPRPLGGEFAVILANGEEQWGEFEVDALSQVIIPNIIGELRDAGFNTPPGTLASMYFYFLVNESDSPRGADGEDIEISASDVYVGVRTYFDRTIGEQSAGKFGLAYGFVPVGEAADSVAYIYGLQQSGTPGQEGGTRTNMGIIHGFGGDFENLELEITYYNSTGSVLGSESKTLMPGQWIPVNAPLSNYPGTSDGYAKIERKKGTDQFIAYGVLNDQGNGDGSYVMAIVP